MESAPVFHPSRSKYLVITADYLIPVFICLSVALGAWLILYTPYFHITTISCTLDFAPCADPVLLAELNKAKGQNIFRLNPNTLRLRLLSGDYMIRQADVTRQLPRTLEINLQSVYPVVALKLDGVDTWITFDSTLRVIGERSADPNVPTVLVQGPLTVTVGKPLTDDATIKALNLARSLADQLFTVKTLTLVDADTIDLTLTSGIHAIFTPKKDVTSQLRALQAVLADATILKGAHTIDVRFAQPVLR